MNNPRKRVKRKFGQSKKEALRQVLINNGKDIATEFSIYDEDIGKNVTRLINQTQTPLDRYYFRGQITEDMFKAGDRLRQTFYRAGLMPKITRNWSGPVGKSQYVLSLSESMIEARQRFYKALESVGGEMKEILHRVCCLDSSAADVMNMSKYQSYKFTERDGIGLLRMALLLLSRYYA